MTAENDETPHRRLIRDIDLEGHRDSYRAGHRDMENFAEAVTDPLMRDRLDRSLQTAADLTLEKL